MAYTDPYVVCAPWIDVNDLCPIPADTTDCNGNTIPLDYPASITDMIEAVSNILFGMTCYRYPGLCSDTIYPCLGCACSCHPCACGMWDAIDLSELPYPLQSVDAVRIDGVVVPPADYVVMHNRWLVKINGDRWPGCNAMNLPETISETVEVDVSYGRVPPIELRLGAARLTEQLYKACNDVPCELPSNVTRVNRRGLDFDVAPLQTLISTGKTGIDILDYALEKYGKCAKTVGVDPAREQSIYRAP